MKQSDYVFQRASRWWPFPCVSCGQAATHAASSSAIGFVVLQRLWEKPLRQQEPTVQKTHVQVGEVPTDATSKS